jgi:GH18 family chitinase
VDPFLCTHINFAFAKVGEDLQIKPYEEDDPQGWTGGPGMYQRVLALRQNNTRLKVMLSLGGWVSLVGIEKRKILKYNLYILNLNCFVIDSCI